MGTDIDQEAFQEADYASSSGGSRNA